MKFTTLARTACLAPVVAAGTVLWDGRFNDLSSSSDLEKWSWGNQVGPYQYYIHGSGAVTDYVNLSPAYGNPADTTSKQGAKLTLDSKAYWNGQNMRRIELIPQTSAAIATGKRFYHFSLKRAAERAPSVNREHQIAFFESHFTEMKAGWLSGAAGTADPALRWMVNQQTKWSVDWAADVWHNVAYEIDFGANTVGFWHSTGGDPLVRVVAPVAAGSTSSNGADFHVGVLELPRSGYPDQDEDFYFSGVYIESGEINTAIGDGKGNNGGGGGGSGSGSTTDSCSTTAKPGGSPTAPTTVITSTTTTKAPAPTTTTTTSQIGGPTRPPTTTTTTAAGSGPGQTKYGQCGGSGYAGPTSCAGSTCSAINEWYHQCL